MKIRLGAAGADRPENVPYPTGAFVDAAES